jgi:L-alanine-DL-glutamate epimerase-like enolase superfamily enzyme
MDPVEARAAFVYGKAKDKTASAGKVSRSLRAQATVTLEDPVTGKRASGRGQMGLAVSWGYPSETLSGEQRLEAMKELVERFAPLLAGCGETGHPIDLYLATKKPFLELRDTICAERGLADVMPDLGALVCGSIFDLATHDAYGHLHGASSYDLLGPEHMAHDLGHYLGEPFAGAYPRDFISAQYAREVRIAHTVAGADALTESEVAADAPDDGVPNSLEAWIAAEGVDAFKLKLMGEVEWDVQRTVDVAKLVDSVAPRLDYLITIDCNEQCPSVEAVVEMLAKIRERSESAWRRLAYVEQPTERDLEAHEFDYRPVTALKPAIVDEGVTELRHLHLAFELGWSGFGLKACKSLSACLLYTALVRQADKMLTVQDLGNTGLAHLASMGIAARVEPFGGVESNGRQFNPRGNDPYRETHASLFRVQAGRISTADLRGSGLGYGEAP